MARRPRYTLYDLLDVSPFATGDELQSAYWRAARKFHPDKTAENLHSGVRPTSGDVAHQEALMKELNQAWEVLGNGMARAAYDASIGLRRPGPTAVSLRNLSARLFRHRPAWRLRARVLDAPDLTPLRRVIVTLRDTLWATRLGQWLTLLVVAMALSGAGGILGFWQGPVTLGALALIALVLARGGEPTPLLDALALMMALVNVLSTVLIRLLRQAAHSAWRAITTPRATSTAHDEQDSAWLNAPDPSPARPKPARRPAGASVSGTTGPRRPGSGR